jgi:uncharacterized protein (TIGR02246 family)
MTELERKVELLERRLAALEDELAIHRLIARYGLAVDTGDAEATAEVFSPDGVYDADVRLMRGREEVRDMVRSDRHQAMIGRCAHQIGPAIVRLDGDRAEALGYSRVYLRDGDGFRIYRVSYNHWRLERDDGGWQIVHRRTRLLGHEEARDVFASQLGRLRADR